MSRFRIEKRTFSAVLRRPEHHRRSVMSSCHGNPRHRFTVIWLLSALLCAHGAALAEDRDEPRPITLLATVPTPGTPLNAFDISWVDPATQMYYLADRSNAAIDVVD